MESPGYGFADLLAGGFPEEDEKARGEKARGKRGGKAKARKGNRGRKRKPGLYVGPGPKGGRLPGAVPG